MRVTDKTKIPMAIRTRVWDILTYPSSGKAEWATGEWYKSLYPVEGAQSEVLDMCEGLINTILKLYEDRLLPVSYPGEPSVLRQTKTIHHVCPTDSYTDPFPEEPPND